MSNISRQHDTIASVGCQKVAKKMKETCYPRDTVILLLLRVYSVAGTFLIVPDYCPALLEQQPAKVRDWALLSATAPCAQIAPCSGVPLIRIAMHKAATFDSFADDPSDEAFRTGSVPLQSVQWSGSQCKCSSVQCKCSDVEAPTHLPRRLLARTELDKRVACQSA